MDQSPSGNKLSAESLCPSTCPNSCQQSFFLTEMHVPAQVVMIQLGPVGHAAACTVPGKATEAAPPARLCSPPDKADSIYAMLEQ